MMSRLVGGQGQGLQSIYGRIQSRLPCLEMARPLLADTTNGQPLGGQTLISIVSPQMQTILSPRSKHPVRLGNPAADQIIDHHPQIGFGARHHEIRKSLRRFLRRIDPRNQPLGPRFFITGRAIDLPGEKQPGDLLGLKRWMQLPWIDIIIFNGIAGTANDSIFKPRNGRQKSPLHLFRK